VADAILAHHHARLILVGFGSVGRGVLPLILRHIAVNLANIMIITADGDGDRNACCHQAGLIVATVTQENHRDILLPLLGPGDLLLNLGVNVSTAAMVVLCREVGALYIDTAIEPWPNVFRNRALPLSQRTSHAVRRALHNVIGGTTGPTALVAHGANPGLVSHFVKASLLQLASDLLGTRPVPCGQPEWAALAQELRIKAIHVTECDTQRSAITRSHGEFVNTWSIEGLVDEISQPAELGWGSHEHSLPPDGCYSDNQASIFLTQPGAATLMRSWTLSCGPYTGFLLSHVEALTISDYYTVLDDGLGHWRPTVQFVYRPCDDALASIKELAEHGLTTPPQSGRLLIDAASGADELGVLLMGHPKGSFWYGSRLSAMEARLLAPPNNATTLQVAAGILGGLVWVLENPHAGLREPDDIDHERVLAVARPYLGELTSAYSNWTPSIREEGYLPDGMDIACPWQFRNFRVY